MQQPLSKARSLFGKAILETLNLLKGGEEPSGEISVGHISPTVTSLTSTKERKLIYIKAKGDDGNRSELPPVSAETETGTERIMTLF